MTGRQRPEYVEQRIARRKAELESFGPLTSDVREILMRDWDPCCISDVPQCADEYDSYIPTVCRIVLDRRTVDDITNYLHFVQSDWMGLRHCGLWKCREVAERMASLDAQTDDHETSTVPVSNVLRWLDTGATTPSRGSSR